MFWQNKDSDEKFDYSLLQSCVVTVSNANFGVWARFAYALNATTEYVCVFDDDTIPGSKWLENCLETIDKQEGLLGAIGVIFKDENYINYDRHGWANPNEETKQVDIVGHSWFFKREWLGAFWREAPVPESRICGEDMHFSYSIQKHLGPRNLCSPSPQRTIMEMWGSHPKLAFEYGVDKNAISVNHHASSFGQSPKDYYQQGVQTHRTYEKNINLLRNSA